MTAVVPALNEAPNLSFVLPEIGPWVDEIVLVAGRSVDRTEEVARALVPEIRIIRQTGTGKGEAVRLGFAAARGDIVVMLDADGSTDPSEIPAFVGALVAGADFVKGTRFAQGAGTEDISLSRRVGNRVLVSVVRVLFGGRFSDLCYGYIALWRRVLPDLDLASDGFEIETEMNVRALRAGLRIWEIPSFERKRIHGKSNLRAVPDGWRVLKTIVRERVRRRSGPAPLRRATPGPPHTRRPRQVAAGACAFPFERLKAVRELADCACTDDGQIEELRNWALGLVANDRPELKAAAKAILLLTDDLRAARNQLAGYEARSGSREGRIAELQAQPQTGRNRGDGPRARLGQPRQR